MGNSKHRLFIDPASISTGWALYYGKTLIAHGTIRVSKRLPIFARLFILFLRYASLAFNADEVHIEQLVRNTHIFTHWSVAVIGVAASFVNRGKHVDADIPITSWQRYCNWEEEKTKVKTYIEQRKIKSEDELAAIRMGEWYLNERCP